MNVRNAWIGSGRLVQDPVIRSNSNGKNVLFFTIAINEGTKEKPYVNYQDCVAYDKWAENIAKYFHKGDQIMLAGRTNNYTIEDRGEKRKVCNIVIESFEFGQKKKQEGEKKEERNEPFPNYEDIDWY